MTREQTIYLLKSKINFVKELNDAIIKVQGNVKHVSYEVFLNKEHETWVDEILVVEYDGGAKSYRCCNGNSYSAIFEEISKRLDHGTYCESEYYNSLMAAVNNGSAELLK